MSSNRCNGSSIPDGSKVKSRYLRDTTQLAAHVPRPSSSVYVRSKDAYSRVQLFLLWQRSCPPAMETKARRMTPRTR